MTQARGSAATDSKLLSALRYIAAGVLLLPPAPAGAQPTRSSTSAAASTRPLTQALSALEARLLALKTLDRQSDNSNERGWLAADIRDVEARM